jgi:hypothetical protein
MSCPKCGCARKNVRLYLPPDYKVQCSDSWHHCIDCGEMLPANAAHVCNGTSEGHSADAPSAPPAKKFPGFICAKWKKLSDGCVARCDQEHGHEGRHLDSVILIGWEQEPVCKNCGDLAKRQPTHTFCPECSPTQEAREWPFKAVKLEDGGAMGSHTVVVLACPTTWGEGDKAFGCVLPRGHGGRCSAFAQETEEFLKGVESVLSIRCMKHRAVPQYNHNESSGGECGACIAEELSAPSPTQEAREWREANGYKTTYSLINPMDRECSPEIANNFHLTPEQFDAALDSFASSRVRQALEKVMPCEAPDPELCDNQNGHPRSCHCLDPLYWKGRVRQLEQERDKLQRQLAAWESAFPATRWRISPDEADQILAVKYCPRSEFASEKSRADSLATLLKEYADVIDDPERKVEADTPLYFFIQRLRCTKMRADSLPQAEI